MVLHKFALPGGKAPAATGMRAAGRPPKAGKRASPVSAAAPPGLRPAGCPENPAPTGRSSFRLVFMGKCSLFAAFVFQRRPSVFCGGDRKSSPHPPQGRATGQILSTLPLADFWVFAVGKNSPHPPQRKAIGSFLSTLAACQFWAFAVGKNGSRPPQGQANGSFLSTLAACRFWVIAVGKNSSRPRKGKPMGRFYPPLPPVDFWPLRWGRIVPIPARARQTDGFFIPYRPVLPTAG